MRKGADRMALRAAEHDELDLVMSAQTGDRAAWEALLGAYMPLLYNVVGRALSGHSDTDDVVQETVLRAVQNLGSLRDPSSFRSWLLAIAMRQVHDAGRARQTRNRFIREVGVPLQDVAPRDATFEERAVESLHLTGQRRAVTMAARWLDPGDRELLALWWQETSGRISRAELAEGLGVSRAHAAVRVQRMKAQLRTARLIEHCLSALPGCPELDELTSRWDGEPSPLWRKRMARHLRGCKACGRGHDLASPEQLLVGLSLVPVAVAVSAKALAAVHIGTSTAVAAGTAAGGIGALQLVAAGQAAEPLGRAAVKHLIVQPKVAALTAGVLLATGSGVGYTLYTHPLRPSSSAGAGASAATAPVDPTSAPASAADPTARAAATTSAADPTAVTTAAVGVTTARYYVAVSGDDDASGSKAHPFASVAQAVAVARPGDVIAVRGGVYRPQESVKINASGTAKKPIVLAAYRHEKVVLDGSGLGDDWLLDVRASYWRFEALEITGAQSGPVVCTSCSSVVFSHLRVHDNLDVGLRLRGDHTTGNLVLDSDLYRNHDDANHGEGASGLAFIYGSGEGNVVSGVRAYENADSGVSIWGFTSAVTIVGSWAFDNGVDRWGVGDWQGDGYGFQLGAGDSDDPAAADHQVVDSAAWGNTGAGFVDSGNTGDLALTRTTAYRNQGPGYQLLTSRATVTSSLAVDNGKDPKTGDDVTVTDSDLDAGTSALTTSGESAATAARGADGTLPTTRFLTARGARARGASMSEAG